MTIHHAAQGFSDGSAAYVRGRPEYPAALGSWLRDELGIGSGTTVVDLGAGTGKFTPLLVDTGARVIAVEPVAAMREKLSAAMPNVEACEGTAESIPLPDSSVDVVICAQAFHWFASAAVLDEIHRVLRPGGRLGLVWNVRDERVQWVAELTEIMTPYEGDAPRYYTGAWRRVFPHAGFGPLMEAHFPNAHTGAPERVIVDRTLSVSFIAGLPSETRELVASEVRALIARTPELAGREEVTFPYDTIAVSCVRR